MVWSSGDREWTNWVRQQHAGSLTEKRWENRTNGRGSLYSLGPLLKQNSHRHFIHRVYANTEKEAESEYPIEGVGEKRQINDARDEVEWPYSRKQKSVKTLLAIAILDRVISQKH